MEGKFEKQIHFPENLTEKIRGLAEKKDRLLILLLGGILLLVIAFPVTEHEKDDTGSLPVSSETLNGKKEGRPDIEAYAAYLEGRLEDTLSEVKGVGKVKAMVTLETSGERIIEKDVNSESESVQESDSQGGSRSTVNSSSSQTTVYEGEGGETSGTPYVTKELMPVVDGIVIIAQGGDNAVTVQNITEAVQALFEIDTHKIKVMKGN